MGHKDKLHEMNTEELKFYPPFSFSSKHPVAGVYVIANVVIIIVLYWKTWKVTQIASRVQVNFSWTIWELVAKCPQRYSMHFLKYPQGYPQITLIRA